MDMPRFRVVQACIKRLYIKMASNTQPSSVSSTHRKVLLHSVSMLCKEEGFHSASQLALETLTEMLQSCKPSCYYVVAPFCNYSISSKKPPLEKAPPLDHRKHKMRPPQKAPPSPGLVIRNSETD